jgi:hypothetical protein
VSTNVLHVEITTCPRCTWCKAPTYVRRGYQVPLYASQRHHVSAATQTHTATVQEYTALGEDQKMRSQGNKSDLYLSAAWSHTLQAIRSATSLQASLSNLGPILHFAHSDIAPTYRQHGC